MHFLLMTTCVPRDLKAQQRHCSQSSWEQRCLVHLDETAGPSLETCKLKMFQLQDMHFSDFPPSLSNTNVVTSHEKTLSPLLRAANTQGFFQNTRVVARHSSLSSSHDPSPSLETRLL